MRQAGEPSVEEILESIKKVIARDNRADAAEARAELVESADLSGDDADQDEVLDLAALDGVEESTEPAPLLAEDAVSSISDSLAALAMLAQPPAAPQIVRSGETSLEALTKELLRPALAEWLDRNLPALVEKLVAAEIARIVSKKG
jgi:cell pole-organizing protein PopZ